MKEKKRLPLVAAVLGATVLTFTANSQEVSAITIFFETDFMTGAGEGAILDQGDPAVAQIFAYEENDVFFRAIPFDAPSSGPPSHFHLFDFVASPATNTDLLLGADAAGLSITLGGLTPTSTFDLDSLDIREVQAGGDVIFEGFNSQGSTGTVLFEAGTVPGAVTLDKGIFGNVQRVDVYYAASGPGEAAPDSAGIIFDDVHITPVPEPGTVIGTGLLGLGLLLYRRRQKGQQQW